MLALIGSSFYAVSRVAEHQVRTSTQKIANESIVTEFMRIHMVNRTGSDSDANDMFKDMSAAYDDPNIDIQTVALDQSTSRVQIEIGLVEDGRILSVLRPMANKLRPYQKKLHVRAYDVLRAKEENDNSLIPPTDRLPVPEKKDTQSDEKSKELEEFTNIKKLGEKGLHFDDVYLKDNQYAFFKPILFHESCIDCHGVGREEPNGTIFRFPSTEALDRNPNPTVFFMRYSVPIEQANQAINSNRAILLATAIITAFLSTAALYVIMRYVIVKPLQHLRGVSEEVSEGNMAVRADLNTGDEFEQLSKSFNRMLRYLSDAQTALKSANRSLDRKVDEQAQLTMKLYELNQIKSDFLHNMSHELRTPLNSIIGFSEVLAEVESLSVKQKGFANNIRKSGKSLLDLINDILDLAKLEAGKAEVNACDFQLVQLAEEVRAMIGKMASDKRIEVILKVEPQLPAVFQDPVKVRQILTNLLSNAIKFTPEGGRVIVRINLFDKDHVGIEVEDTGVGISDSDQSIIFEKFRQGTVAAGGNLLTRQHEGTGLGLSIVKELCVLLGGAVKVESEIGKGSTFMVTLPVRYRSDLCSFEPDQQADPTSLATVGDLTATDSLSNVEISE